MIPAHALEFPDPQAAPILEKLIQKYNVKSVIEIGSFIGQTAVFFAKHTQIEKVICIDPFKAEGDWARDLEARGIPNPFYCVFEENLRRRGLLHKIEAIRAKSSGVAVRDLPEVDMLFIDGDHSYEGCLSDIKLYAYKAKLVCGDDYHTDENGVPYFPGVRRAVQQMFPAHEYEEGTWWAD